MIDAPITDPAAWTVASVGGKAGLTRKLSTDEVTAIHEVVAATSDIEPTAVTRAAFDHPLVNTLMDDVRQRVMDGACGVILAGLDASDRGFFERAYWGLGTHLGIGVEQSAAGDRIGQVRVAESATPRGYLSSIELRPHTDFHQVLSLAGVTLPVSGGLSGLVSALSIHNVMLAERPDLLPPLYEGFWYGLHESAGGRQPISEEKVPVFSVREGKLSCMNNRFFMLTAARRMGTELPGKLVEALDCFAALSIRPDLYLEFQLEPGEMMFWHNFVLLHARSEFRDSADRKRLLLRLWLDVPDGRPVVPAISGRARQVDHRPQLTA